MGGFKMRKWSEIKQATLNKLFLSESEAQQQGYLEKFQYLANECLNIIANGVKPRIAKLVVDIYDKTVEGENFVLNNDTGKLSYTKNGESFEVTPVEKVIYFESDYAKYEYKNGELIVTDNGSAEHNIITMPDDYLSLADMVNYYNGEPEPTIIYIDDKHVQFPLIGRYEIFYNALWNDVTKEDILNDNVLKIDISVINCLPTYMASQLLRQDDIQSSTILKNEFELLLSRLDTQIMYQEKHFKSTGGWY